MFAEIILNNNAKALNKIFDYEVPIEFEKKVHIGTRVFVPFGKSKTFEDGFIVKLKEISDYANKPIASVQEDYLDETKIELAKLMAQKYFCNLSECIKLMLPPGTASKKLDSRIKEKLGNFVYLAKEIDELEILIENKVIKSEKQIKIIRFLKENDGMYSPDLEAILEVGHGILKTLEKNGYIEYRQEEIKRNPFINKNVKTDKKKKLNEEQLPCYESIKKDIDSNNHSINLIFGITGSR